MKPDMAEGFELLDMDGGAGWSLLCDLMEYKPKDRYVCGVGVGVELWSNPVPLLVWQRVAAGAYCALTAFNCPCVKVGSVSPSLRLPNFPHSLIFVRLGNWFPNIPSFAG